MIGMKKPIDENQSSHEDSISYAIIFSCCSSQRSSSAPPSSAVSGAGGGGSSASSMFQQFQQVQDDVAELRGIVEEQSHQIEQLQAQQKEQYLDLDRRLSALQGGGGAATGPSTGGGAAIDGGPTTGPTTSGPTTAGPTAPSGNSLTSYRPHASRPACR